jgi:hypothetical protein
MQVRIHYDVPRDRFQVFVFTENGNYLTQDGGVHRFDPGDAGAKAKPYCEMRTDIYQAVAEYIISGERGPATERHLNDATSTRDRLLALVELGFREHVAPSESLNPLDDGPGSKS